VNRNATYELMKLIFLILFMVLPATIWAETKTFQVSYYDEEYMATVFGSTGITEEFSMSVEVGSSGYRPYAPHI